MNTNASSLLRETEIVDAPTEPAAKIPRRRWFQYSLRSLLALITLAAVGLSLLYAHIARYRSQLDAVEELQPYAVFQTQPGAWSWLRRWRGESDPVDVVACAIKMQSARPDHPALAALPQLFRLKSLNLLGVPMTGKTLSYVGQLAELEGLDLRWTPINDDDAVYLMGLKKLKWIGLDGTNITDQTIERLAELPDLEGLSICCAGVTDASLPHLLRLKKLKSVNCYESTMSGDAIQELANGLNIEITGACSCGCCDYRPQKPAAK